MASEKDKGDDKTLVVGFRVTKQEYEELRKKGSALKLSVHDYAKRKMRTALDLETIALRIDNEARAREEMEKAVMDRLDSMESRLVSEFSSIVSEDAIVEICLRSVRAVLDESKRRRGE